MEISQRSGNKAQKVNVVCSCLLMADVWSLNQWVAGASMQTNHSEAYFCITVIATRTVHVIMLMSCMLSKWKKERIVLIISIRPTLITWSRFSKHLPILIRWKSRDIGIIITWTVGSLKSTSTPCKPNNSLKFFVDFLCFVIVKPKEELTQRILGFIQWVCKIEIYPSKEPVSFQSLVSFWSHLFDALVGLTCQWQWYKN